MLQCKPRREEEGEGKGEGERGEGGRERGDRGKGGKEGGGKEKKKEPLVGSFKISVDAKHFHPLVTPVVPSSP